MSDRQNIFISVAVFTEESDELMDKGQGRDEQEVGQARKRSSQLMG